MPGAWSLDDIDWSRFDRRKVDANLLRVVKAASLVEHNGGAYTDYLCRVFSSDEQFKQAARQWGEEEIRHGQALARWAELADPDFSFNAAMTRFNAGYNGLPEDTDVSVRGSQASELVARCIVESGTSSYYSALADAAEEPVLEDICRRIASDEFRHYKLFYTTLDRYVEKEDLGKLGRLRVAWGRLGETEDDELSYAYYAANAAPDDVYVQNTHGARHLWIAYGYYKPRHVQRAASMILKAAGLSISDRTRSVIGYLGWRFMQYRRSKTGIPVSL